MKNEEYREATRNTKFGKLIAGTSFEDYAINNKQFNENNLFIEKKYGTSKFSFAFIYWRVNYLFVFKNASSGETSMQGHSISSAMKLGFAQCTAFVRIFCTSGIW